jgi:hypothetical protein
MYYGTIIKIGKANTFLIPAALLFLFVCSAAITGFLIFGKPATLYVDGKKKEAIKLLYYTLGFFSFITIFGLLLLILFTK